MVASILFPVAHAAPSPATLDLTFKSATVNGSATCASTTVSALLLLPGEGTFSWRLNAEHLNVNWTEKTRTEVGRPPSFEETYYKNTQGATSGEAQFTEATATSGSNGSRSNLGVVDPSSSLGLRFRNATSQVVSAGAPQWSATTDAPDLVSPIDLRRGSVEVAIGNTTLSIVGNFSIHLWDATVLVEDDSKGSRFRSGNWTEPVGPSTGNPSAVRNRHYQTLRLDVTDGTLELTLTGRPATWRALEASFEGNFRADMVQASGTVENAGRVHQIQESSFGVAGDGLLTVSNATDASRSVKGFFEMERGTFEAPVTVPLDEGVPPGLAAGAPTMARAAVSPWWWLSALVLLPLVFLGVVRFDLPRPDITDVEWAILTRHDWRARRWARRMVKREPQNSDAVFLYATTLLQANRFPELLAKVEPMAAKFSRRTRSGIAYILAVAASMVNDVGKSRKWAKEAAREPELRERMKAEAEWADVIESSRVKDPVLVGYV